MSQVERESIYFIPKNFKTGISLFGNTFQTKNVMQMNIVCIPITLLVFWKTNFQFSTKLSIVILINLVLGYLCIVGINERPLFSLISSFYSYEKSKYRAYYNFRIKIEAHPTFIEVEEENLLPKEKLQKIYEKFKEKYDAQQREKILRYSAQIEKDRDSIYFIDDIGIVEKPTEYMNPKEYRKYQKLQKKKQKEVDDIEKNKD